MYKYCNWTSGLRWLARLNFTDVPPHAFCSSGVGKPTPGNRRKISPKYLVTFWSLDLRFPLAQLQSGLSQWGMRERGKKFESPLLPSPWLHQERWNIMQWKKSYVGYAHASLSPNILPLSQIAILKLLLELPLVWVVLMPDSPALYGDLWHMPFLHPHPLHSRGHGKG